MGRQWVSDTGNLFASTAICLRPSDPPAPTLGMMVSVALIETLLARAPHLPFILKWPNDVLCGKAKISGILLERAGDTVVVGLGVNLRSFPADLEREVTSLAELGVPAPDPHAFLIEFAQHFALWLDRWRSEGVAGVLTSWRQYAHQEGTQMTCNLPDGTHLAGEFASLDNDGTLNLRLADGSIRAIHAGDVFLV